MTVGKSIFTERHEVIGEGDFLCQVATTLEGIAANHFQSIIDNDAVQRRTALEGRVTNGCHA